MSVETVSGIYARALLELAQEKDVLHDVREETAFLSNLFEREKGLWTFVESPRIPKGERIDVFERTLRGKVSDELLNFMLLVFSKGRQVFFFDILKEFGALYDKVLGLVRARVTTAVPLSDEQTEAIRQRLAGALDKTIDLEKQTDETLLGGFVIRFDGMVADASIRSALETIRGRMLSVRFGSEMIHED